MVLPEPFAPTSLCGSLKFDVKLIETTMASWLVGDDHLRLLVPLTELIVGFRDDRQIIINNLHLATECSHNKVAVHADLLGLFHVFEDLLAIRAALVERVAPVQPTFSATAMNTG